MTLPAIFVTVWRRVTGFLEALDEGDHDPVEQQRWLSGLEERVASLERAHARSKCCRCSIDKKRRDWRLAGGRVRPTSGIAPRPYRLNGSLR